MLEINVWANFLGNDSYVKLTARRDNKLSPETTIQRRRHNFKALQKQHAALLHKIFDATSKLGGWHRHGAYAESKQQDAAEEARRLTRCHHVYLWAVFLKLFCSQTHQN